MGAYAYCAVPVGHAPPSGTAGIDGSMVRELNMGAVSLWISDIARPAASTAAILAHNRVVEAAITDAVTPVPIRFGQWSADPESLAEAAANRIAGWRELLARFAGALEFGLRVIERPSVEASPQTARVVRTGSSSSGRAYLESLKSGQDAAARVRAQAGEFGRRIDETVDGLIRQSRVEPLATEHGVASIAHLVARADFDAYRAAIEQIRTAEPRYRFLLSGPWPPYSFSL